MPQLNQIDSSGFAVASSFPDSRDTVSNANNSLPCVSTNHLMIQGNSQQKHNARAFRNQSSARASFKTESFDTTGICGSSNLLDYNRCNENWQSGAQLPEFPASSVNEPSTSINVSNSNTDIGNSPVDFSSGITSTVPLKDARNELTCQDGYINGASPWCTEADRFSTDMQDGFIQNFGTLDEIMGAMVNWEQNEMTMMDGEMGFDAYPVGSCI